MCVCVCVRAYYNHSYQEFIIKEAAKGEYLTLTIPCTNALCKVWSVNHRVLSFCINTLIETKDSLIGVNSVVLGIVQDINISIVHVSKSITGHV